eukprot:c16881_g1_i1 orf=437-1000(-)
MDNNKSKDDLRAAGKKKLELFRSKQKKAAASKVAASSPKLASGAGSHAGGSTKHAQIEQHLSTGEDNLGIGHSDASRDVEIPDSRTDRADTLDISVENENTKTNEFLACEQNELAAELCHDMQGQEPLPLDKTNAYTEQGYAEGMNEDLQGQGSQEPCPMDNSMQAEQVSNYMRRIPGIQYMEGHSW